ncbi:MAG TPA: rhodanese-like domain-containing protein [Candidatus Angelobacter sp.]|nr:rhodanese-like domain-containing protein [Candidatus Angelobacter sp.]
MSAYSKSETQPRASRVAAISPEDPKTAEIHFRSRLAFETDPSDVYTDLQNNSAEIMVIDARTQEAYSQGHLPGAINIPWRKIDASSTSAMPRDKALITYCDGRLC